MRKYLIPIIFILSIFSTANANSLIESFPENNSGIISININFLKYFFEVDKEQSSLKEYYNTVNAIIKQKLGIDFEKDVEQIGLFFHQSNNKKIPIGFISGNFNYDSIMPIIESNITSEPNLLGKIKINKEEKNILHLNSYDFIAQNSKTIWFCNESDLNSIIQNPICFSSAPEYISTINNISGFFIYLNKDIFFNIFDIDQKNITIDLDSLLSVSACIKNYDIFIVGNLDSEESAKTLKLQLDYFFNNLNETLSKENIKLGDSSKNIFNQINHLYLLSRVKDIIDSLKLQVKGKSLEIKFPFNRTNFCNAISDFITNIAIPKYQKSIEETNIAMCYHYQHLLTKAVEKFNNENDPMMTWLDELTLSVKNYNPYDYDFKGRGCKYKAIGKLDDGGYVTCEVHGTAIPLIKPVVSKERQAEEEEIFKCNNNKKNIYFAVKNYNRDISNNSNHSDSPDNTSLMLEKLDLELLKTNDFLENLIETKNCNYYIYGNLNDPEGRIACKKHGPLKKISSFDYEYSEYQTRRASKIKNEVKNMVKPLKNDKTTLCLSNIRVITAAIEMYNMDYSDMMTELDLDQLVKCHYLKEIPIKPTDKCDYYIVGDILSDGYVACKIHGSISDYQD